MCVGREAQAAGILAMALILWQNGADMRKSAPKIRDRD